MRDPLTPYFTLIIPFAPREHATEWHPTEEGGTFDPLTRGVFPDQGMAILWAQEHLNGTPYSIRKIDPMKPT